MSRELYLLEVSPRHAEAFKRARVAAGVLFVSLFTLFVVAAPEGDANTEAAPAMTAAAPGAPVELP